MMIKVKLKKKLGTFCELVDCFSASINIIKKKENSHTLSQGVFILVSLSRNIMGALFLQIQ